MALERHALSEVFPDMNDREFNDLTESIKAQGLLEPITIFEGRVLDGWHRYRACVRTRTPVRTMPFDGACPVAYVIAKNAARRHLSAGQRAVAIVSARAWRAAGDQNGLGMTVDEMARAADVSRNTIRRAKNAVRDGLGEKIMNGDATIYEHRKKRARLVRPRPHDNADKDDQILKLRQELAERDTKILELCDAIAAYTEAESDLAGHSTHLHNAKVQVRHLENMVTGLRRRIDYYCEKLGVNPEEEERYGHIVHT